MMRLILVRHGESQHSKRRLIAGRSACLGLTETGLQQAEHLAVRWRTSGEVGQCAALLSSPVLRAAQTAAALATVPGFPEVREEDALMEIIPGAADGMHWLDYVERFGEFDLIAEPERPFAPEGESWSQFIQRVMTAMQTWAEAYDGKTVIAVTHSGFIVVTLLMLFAIPRPGTGAQFHPRYASLTEWQFDQGVWTLERFNDISHLTQRQS
jgi:broad specificity phosphatase PhoE